MNIDPNKWNFPTVTEKEWDKLLETMTADEACKLIQNGLLIANMKSTES